MLMNSKCHGTTFNRRLTCTVAVLSRWNAVSIFWRCPFLPVYILDWDWHHFSMSNRRHKLIAVSKPISWRVHRFGCKWWQQKATASVKVIFNNTVFQSLHCSSLHFMIFVPIYLCSVQFHILSQFCIWCALSGRNSGGDLTLQMPRQQ